MGRRAVSEPFSGGIRSIREKYESNPARTIDSLSRESGLTWEATYRVLSGDAHYGQGLENLVQHRIEHATVLQQRAENRCRRVRPERGALARFERIVLKARKAQERARVSAPPKREPYVGLIGSSARAAALKRWAARKAASVTRSSDAAAPDRA